MEIYVKSRGKNQDQDYCWIHITDKGQQKQSPYIPEQVIDLIESDDFSVVIARFSGKLLLLITGLKSSRTDFQRRIIRNSIAWLGQGSDEPLFRQIAANALRGLLAKSIDSIVKISPSNKECFQALWEEFRQLTGKNEVGNLPPDSNISIEENSELLRKQLADEIEKYQLPQQEGPLVVVTGIKARETLEKAGVWRGLSNFIRTEDRDKISQQRPIPPNLLITWVLRNFSKLSIVAFAIVVLVTGILFNPWAHETTIDFSHDLPLEISVPINERITFKGKYKPTETKTIILCADKYKIGEYSPKPSNLSREEEWTISYHFKASGPKNIVEKQSTKVSEEIKKERPNNLNNSTDTELDAWLCKNVQVQWNETKAVQIQVKEK